MDNQVYCATHKFQERSHPYWQERGIHCAVCAEAMTTCPDCDGEGRTPNGSCTGDQAGGWADTCEMCNGTGAIKRERFPEC